VDGKEKRQSRNGLRDNETRGAVNRPASGSGGAHQQLPVRETETFHEAIALWFENQEVGSRPKKVNC
jgi:hypothetical protein